MAFPLSVQTPAGTPLNMRGGKAGDGSISEYSGRFYEQAYAGLLYSGGMTVTSINNATFTSATLGNTATPIVGIWNPISSGLNAVVLQATLNIIITALTNTGGGPFVWASSVGNSAISTGGTPWSRKTLAQSGSLMKNMAGVALTGLTNNLVVMHGSGLGGGSAFSTSTVDTAVGFNPTNSGAVENLDGSMLVPPGGVLALLATTTPVAQSAASALLWAEVAI